MKLFSQVSATVTLSLLALTGFSQLQGDEVQSTETMQAESVISHYNDGNGNGSSSRYNSRPSSMDDPTTARQASDHPNTVLDSARGCPGRDGFYFDVEFLWLRAVEDSIDYAWRTNDAPDQTSRDVHSYSQGFEFDPGFRVGVGYNMGYDNWDVHLFYQWHYSYPKSSIRESNPGDQNVFGLLGMLPLNDSSLTVIGYESARSSWQLQFNTWDFDLGRAFFVGRHLSLRPVFGLKGALIHQHLHAIYDNAQQFNSSSSPRFNNLQVRFKSRWWGVGIKAGTSASYDLGVGFSLNGDVYGALLYGEFSIDDNINAVIDRDVDNLGVQNGGHFFDNFYRLRPMVYLSLSLDWGRCFWDWMHFNIHVGWESQYWWQQMEFISFEDLTPDGDLSLTGLNAGIRFDF